jgi:hypothetical protein
MRTTDFGSTFDIRGRITTLSPSDSLLAPPVDTRRYESIANSIVNLDSRIYSCLIVSDPSGATLAEATKPEMKYNLGSLTQQSGGMVGHWGIQAFKTMARLDGIRTKARYIVVGREKFNAIIFPLESEKNLMIGMTFDPDANPREIFIELMKLLEKSPELARARLSAP